MRQHHDAPQPDHTAEPAPAAAPDPEAAFVHLMNAVESMSTMLAHIQGAVPALHGLLGHLGTIGRHVTAARNALNPPVDIPPKE